MLSGLTLGCRASAPCQSDAFEVCSVLIFRALSRTKLFAQLSDLTKSSLSTQFSGFSLGFLKSSSVLAATCAHVVLLSLAEHRPC